MALTILLAEDDRITLLTYARILSSRGHIVIKANDGQLALEILKQNPHIDALVTDVQMPRVSGDELVSRVREELKNYSTQILVISGVVSVTDGVRLLERGANRFMVKPVRPKTLIAEIDRMNEWAQSGAVAWHVETEDEQAQTG